MAAATKDCVRASSFSVAGSGVGVAVGSGDLVAVGAGVAVGSGALVSMGAGVAVGSGALVAVGSGIGVSVGAGAVVAVGAGIGVSVGITVGAGSSPQATARAAMEAQIRSKSNALTPVGFRRRFDPVSFTGISLTRSFLRITPSGAYCGYTLLNHIIAAYCTRCQILEMY